MRIFVYFMMARGKNKRLDMSAKLSEHEPQSSLQSYVSLCEFIIYFHGVRLKNQRTKGRALYDEKYRVMAHNETYTETYTRCVVPMRWVINSIRIRFQCMIGASPAARAQTTSHSSPIIHLDLKTPKLRRNISLNLRRGTIHKFVKNNCKYQLSWKVENKLPTGIWLKRNFSNSINTLLNAFLLRIKWSRTIYIEHTGYTPPSGRISNYICIIFNIRL